MQPDNNKATKTSQKQGTRKLRWWQIALIVAAGLLVVVGGTLVWLLNDTARVKVAVERLVSTLTDRPFHINGEFDFTLGSEITVSAAQIVWDNAAWSSQPTMLTVENAQASVDFRSILQPPILITNAVASNARLDFEWSPENVSNWYLVKSDKPRKKKPLHPLPLLLDKTNLRNVELHFKHPSLTEELIILVTTAEQQQDENNRLVASIQTLIDNREIELTGRIGPFPELVIAGKVDFDIQAVGPNSTMSIKGDVDKLAGLKGPDVELAFTAPEIATVLDIFNLPEVTHGPAELNGSLASAGESATGSLQGYIGEFNIDGAFQAANLRPLKGLSAHLTSQGPSARAAGNTVGIGGLPPEPYALKVRLLDQEDGLEIEEVSFKSAGAVVTASGTIHEFPALANMNVQLQADVEDISRFGGLLPGEEIPAAPLSLKVSVISNTDRENDSLDAKMQLGQLDAQLSGLLTEDSKFVGSRFDFSAQAPDSKKLGATIGVPILKSAELQLNGDVEITDSGVNLRKASGSIGPHNYSLSGEIPFATKNLQLDMDTAVDGPNLYDAVSMFAAVDRVPSMPYKLGGKLSFTGNQLKLKPISGSIGDNQIKTDGTLEFGRDIPDIDLQITASGKNLASVLQTQGLEGGPAEPYSFSGKLTVATAGVSISDLNFGTADDQLRGDISVGLKENAGLINFDLAGSGGDLQEILPEIPGYQPAAVPFDVKAKGEIQEQQVNIPNLTAKLGSATINLSGTVDLPPNLKATGVSFTASGPNLSELGATKGLVPAAIPFDISATMGGTTNNVEINDFNITAGPSDLHGAFRLNTEGKPEAELQLTSAVLDIRTLQKTLEQESTDPAKKTAQQEQPTKDKRLIPDEPLPVDLLNSLNGSVQLEIDKLVAQRFDLGKVIVKGTLRDGTLDIPDFSASTRKGVLQGEIHVSPAGEKTGIEVTATAKNLVLAIGKLDEELRQNHPGQDVDLHLTSQGSSYREVAASLNGYMWFRGGERQIKANELGFLFGDFLSEVFSTINPFANKDPYQTLECDRIFFEIVDGVAQTSPAILLRTDKLNMTAVGAVNLSTEKLDFAIETSPRTGIGLSAGDLVNPFIKISGTMAKPGIALDPAGTLIEGGAAVATMGITLVAKSMYKRWLSPRNPCQKLTADAREIRRKQDPDNVPAD